ncbi:ecdysone-induced protein 74EF-like isoform X1 [Procambarus clarkii]|uniref:ecdysone-induced protein 74EF-like isoform X1 n=2 Tax=Procambarus clarkii TaxID=6728 RepID=UPI0037438C75
MMLLHSRRLPTACGKKLAWLQAPTQHSVKRFRHRQDSGLEALCCWDNVSLDLIVPSVMNPEGRLHHQPIPYVMDPEGRLHQQSSPSLIDPEGRLHQQPSPSLMDPEGRLHQRPSPSLMDPEGRLHQQPSPSLIDPEGRLHQRPSPSLMDPEGRLHQRPSPSLMDPEGRLHQRPSPSLMDPEGRLHQQPSPSLMDPEGRLHQQPSPSLMDPEGRLHQQPSPSLMDPEGRLHQQPSPSLMDPEGRLHQQPSPSLMDPEGRLHQQPSPSLMDPEGRLHQQPSPSLMDPEGRLHQQPSPSLMDSYDAPYEWNFRDPDPRRRPLDAEASSVLRSKPTASNKIFPILCKSVPSSLPQTLETFDNSEGKLTTGTQNQKPQKRKPGRPPKPKGDKQHLMSKKIPKIWEFISSLLHDPTTCPSVVEWQDKENGIFRFVDPQKAGKLWGAVKNNPYMNYEKMSRAMRYHYTTEALEMVKSKRLVYKFGIKARV